MFKKILRLGVCCAIIINTAGCTNTPTSTNADIPLVHSSLSYSLTPENQAINIPKINTHDGQHAPLMVNVNGTQYQSTKHYVSATGNKCIRFTSVQKENLEVMTTCKRDGQWRVISPLVVSSSQKG